MDHNPFSQPNNQDDKGKNQVEQSQLPPLSSEILSNPDVVDTGIKEIIGLGVTRRSLIIGGKDVMLYTLDPEAKMGAVTSNWIQDGLAVIKRYAEAGRKIIIIHDLHGETPALSQLSKVPRNELTLASKHSYTFISPFKDPLAFGVTTFFTKTLARSLFQLNSSNKIVSTIVGLDVGDTKEH